MRNENFKKAATSASCVATAALMLLGGAQILAYMTDTETATNTFTVGKVKVDIEEPNYPGNDSDEVKELVPNEPVPKDPMANNSGDNAAAIFMSYDVPMSDVLIVGNDGRLFTDGKGGFYINAEYDEDGQKWIAKATKSEKLGSTNSAGSEIVGEDVDVTEILPADRKPMHQEIFGVNSNGKQGADATKWTLIKTVYIDSMGNEIAETEKDSAAGIRRIYSYNTLIGKGEQTTALFDEAYLKNVVEGHGDATIQQLTTKVYAIQAAYLKDADGNNILNFDEDDQTASDITVSEEDAKKIYDIYVGQNGTNLPDIEADNNGASGLEGNDREDAEMYLKVSMSVDDTTLNVSEDANASVAVDTNYRGVTYQFTAHDMADGSDADNSEVISVNANSGKITALKPGVAYVKVTATKTGLSGGDKTATAIVKIVVQNELKVTLTSDDASIMKKDGTKQLVAAAETVQPGGANVTYTYKSSNEKVATVSETGLVTAHDSGSAVITVTATIPNDVDGGNITATASYDVFVQN